MVSGLGKFIGSNGRHQEGKGGDSTGFLVESGASVRFVLVSIIDDGDQCCLEWFRRGGHVDNGGWGGRETVLWCVVLKQNLVFQIVITRSLKNFLWVFIKQSHEQDDCFFGEARDV